MSRRKFGYNYDDLLVQDDELRQLEIRQINHRWSSEYVLLLSPDADDDSIPLSWPAEGKKMSDAPGALAINQLVHFCWLNSEQKWAYCGPNVEGHSLMYQMYALRRTEDEAGEHCLILRQWLDTPRVKKNVSVQQRFIAVPWSKSLLSMSSKEGGVSQDDRFVC